MDISLVLHATDPARTADFVRALGIRVDNPNRPNPGSWTANLNVSLVITDTADRQPGISVGVREHDTTLARLIDLLGQRAITAERDGGEISAAGPDGLRIDVARDAPWKQHHDIWDVGYLYGVMPRFKENRKRVTSALQAVCATNPRLAGPNLAKLAAGCWWLVVDAPEDSDPEPAQRVLEELRSNRQHVQIKRASEIDPELLALIDKKAFEI